MLVGQRDVAVEPGQWDDVRSMSARGVLLVALSGLLGYALTMLLRSTVATLGILLGFAAAGSLGSGATYLLVVLVVMMAASVMSFRRRDLP